MMDFDLSFSNQWQGHMEVSDYNRVFPAIGHGSGNRVSIPARPCPWLGLRHKHCL